MERASIITRFMLHIEERKAEKIQRLLKYEKTGFLERGNYHI